MALSDEAWVNLLRTTNTKILPLVTKEPNKGTIGLAARSFTKARYLPFNRGSIPQRLYFWQYNRISMK